MPPKPLILAFDTSVAHCAAALLSGDRIIRERVEPMDKGQAERLFPLLEEILADAGFGWSDITRIGVGTGPGNFTGIRISVSAARGLALSLGVPAIGVTSFEALTLGLEQPVLASLDARAGRTYLQLFSGDIAEPAETIDDSILPADMIRPGLSVVGHNAASLSSGTDIKTLTALNPVAVAIAKIVASAIVSDHPRPAPVYLRVPDAAPPRDTAPTIIP